ncbi:MAG: hypothetical protein APR54_10995 [Candidatus Cloacimonas sp. SDB]|nr:MAG: hypothetical protein APR54_10995 [Candidatus Cloacimonas sp. SDB]
MLEKKQAITINMLQANLYSLPIIIFITIIMMASYLFIWGKTYFLAEFFQLRLSLFIPILIGGFVLHELIHVMSYHFLGKVPFSNLKIGFKLKSITPYAYCSQPILLSAYRLSALMPGIILGIIPAIISLITGNTFIFILAVIFLIAAGGDLLIIWMLRKIPLNYLVQDHPEKAGCIIIGKK